MATWLSNGGDSGGANDSGSFVAGTQTVQFIHDNFAGNGDFITIPDVSLSTPYLWSNGVNITKPVYVQAANMVNNDAFTTANQVITPTKVYIQFNSTTPTNLFTLNVSTLGHVTLAGINFLPGVGTSTQNYVTAQGGGTAPGTYIIRMHDCTFSIPNFQINCAVRWFATGGVVWHCHLFGSGAPPGGADSAGTKSATFQIQSNVPWSNKPTWGTLDTNGTGNLYIEDSMFTASKGQANDIDTNGRLVARHNVYNNSVCTQHGITSLQGGMHTEYYNNLFDYFAFSATPGTVYGTYTKVIGTSQTPPNDSLGVPGYWPDISNGWYWLRAGTTRVSNNTVTQIYSYGYWPYPTMLLFFNDSLTRAGSGFGSEQTDADYAGWHWCGSCGGDTGDTSVPPSYTSYQVSYNTGGAGNHPEAPVYFWSNTFQGTANLGAEANQWAPGDWSTQTQGARNPNPGPPFDVNHWATVDTFLINRDIFTSAPASYTTYTYPHPLRTASTGGGTSPGSGLTAAADATLTKTVVGVTSGAYVTPTNNWLALYSTQFTAQTKAGATEWTTASDTAPYARVAMGATGTGWTIAAYANGVGVVFSNTANLNFAAVAGNAQTLFSISLTDSVGPTGGNVNLFVDLSTALTVPLTIALQFVASTGIQFTTY